MPSTVVLERLEQLLVENQNRILPLVNNNSVKMYASLRDGNLSLEMRSPQGKYLPDFVEGTHGIQVEIDKGNEALGPRLIFTSKDPDLNVVFFSLADSLCDTVEHSASEEETVSSVLTRFEDFRELMQGERRSLSQESARGLVAEHLVLLEYLNESETNYESLIRGWKGPFGGNKDFIFGNKGFEVKSIRPNATSIKISGINQLDPNGLELCLLTYCLDQVGNEHSGDEIFTLRSLVNAVKGKLSRNHMANSLYLIALTQTGYEEDEQGFADVRYRLQKKIVYEVMDGFPKLVASSIPAGVEKIEYSVNIAAIQEFIRESGENTIDL